MRPTTLSPAPHESNLRQPGEDCRNDIIQQQEEDIETCFALFLLENAFCWKFGLASKIGNPSCASRYETKLKHTSDDEIRLAGLEALVHKELEKHLILNSNGLRTFEDARLEIVAYVEAKLGLRTAIPSRLNRELEDTVIQWILT